MNKKIQLNKYFKIVLFYRSPSYLAKSLYDSEDIKNDRIIKNINELLINLKNSINSEEIPENENPKKKSILLKKSLNLINKKKVKDSK